MSEMYYIRWKSQLSGPLPADEIKEMLTNSRLTKHHQISIDKGMWTPLCESDEFRASCCVATVTDVTPAGVPIQTTIRLQASSPSGLSEEDTRSKLRIVQPEEKPITERWFYVEESETVGPVGISELRQLVETGLLTQHSPVCKEGEEQWVKTGDVFPEFWQTSSRPSPSLRQHESVTKGNQAVSVSQNNYGGIGRLYYFLGNIGLWLLCTFLELFDLSIINILVGGVLTFVLVVQRLRNIGMSGWWSLLILVPIANLFITVPCLVYPEGYHHTKKLDTAGRVIVVIMIVFFIISLLCVLLYVLL